MLEAKDVMDNFMKKLDESNLRKENVLCGEQDMTSAFVNEQLRSYSKLLKLGIMQQFDKEE